MSGNEGELDRSDTEPMEEGPDGMGTDNPAGDGDLAATDGQGRPTARERLNQLRARGFTERQIDALQRFSDEASIRTLPEDKLRDFAEDAESELPAPGSRQPAPDSEFQEAEERLQEEGFQESEIEELKSFSDPQSLETLSTDYLEDYLQEVEDPAQDQEANDPTDPDPFGGDSTVQTNQGESETQTQTQADTQERQTVDVGSLPTQGVESQEGALGEQAREFESSIVSQDGISESDVAIQEQDGQLEAQFTQAFAQSQREQTAEAFGIDPSGVELVQDNGGIQPTLTDSGREEIRAQQAEEWEDQFGVDIEPEDIELQDTPTGIDASLNEETQSEIETQTRTDLSQSLSRQTGVVIAPGEVTLEDGSVGLTDEAERRVRAEQFDEQLPGVISPSDLEQQDGEFVLTDEARTDVATARLEQDREGLTDFVEREFERETGVDISEEDVDLNIQDGEIQPTISGEAQAEAAAERFSERFGVEIEGEDVLETEGGTFAVNPDTLREQGVVDSRDATQVRTREDVESQLEQQLEEATGAELSRNDIQFTESDGEIQASLTESGREAAEIERAPFQGIPILEDISEGVARQEIAAENIGDDFEEWVQSGVRNLDVERSTRGSGINVGEQPEQTQPTGMVGELPESEGQGDLGLEETGDSIERDIQQYIRNLDAEEIGQGAITVGTAGVVAPEPVTSVSGAGLAAGGALVLGGVAASEFLSEEQLRQFRESEEFESVQERDEIAIPEGEGSELNINTELFPDELAVGGGGTLSELEVEEPGQDISEIEIPQLDTSTIVDQPQDNPLPTPDSPSLPDSPTIGEETPVGLPGEIGAPTQGEIDTPQGTITLPSEFPTTPEPEVQQPTRSELGQGVPEPQVRDATPTLAESEPTSQVDPVEGVLSDVQGLADSQVTPGVGPAFSPIDAPANLSSPFSQPNVVDDVFAQPEAPAQETVDVADTAFEYDYAQETAYEYSYQYGRPTRPGRSRPPLRFNFDFPDADPEDTDGIDPRLRQRQFEVPIATFEEVLGL